MNQQLLPEEVALLTRPVMTRREKLLRFAEIVRSHRDRPFGLYHNLEGYHPEQLNSMGLGGSAFAAAAADPILRDAGADLHTVGDAQRFFELSQHELHEFSCDCGGAIDGNDMANRIESIAARS
jgi:hypothetical protein